MIDYDKVDSPCYVIDESLLRDNLSLIHSVAERSGAKIILAFKGFAMWSVFPIVKEYVNGISASSPDEVTLGKREMGVLAHTYSPAYSDDEFETVMNGSSHITFNSIAQFERFADRVKSYPRKISMGLRINPEFCEVSTALYNPCAPGSRLGITAPYAGKTPFRNRRLAFSRSLRIGCRRPREIAESS